MVPVVALNSSRAIRAAAVDRRAEEAFMMQQKLKPGRK
jgi:hypothetical protein